MSERKFIIPEYGPFAGMRVVCSGSLVAMPFAATMLADFGAEVIQIERPGVGDTLRMLAPFAEVNGKKVSTAWAQNARNKLAMALELNLKFDEVKEIFYGLIKEADIFMENMVWLDKLGIYDEELLKVNPKLVIVHVSGMGHKEFGGIPSVCNRASYDMIGQAFSGWLYLQGDPDRDPAIAKPYTNDYVSAFATVFAALSGYIYAQKTGKGQVIDVAQFEAMAQYMCGTYTAYTMAGIVGERTGNCPLEAMAIEYAQLRGTQDGMDFTAITDIAEFFEKDIGYVVPPRTPFVGRSFNSTRAGIHADGLLKDEEIYNIFDTTAILNRPATVAVDSHSGLAGIAHWMNGYFHLKDADAVDKRHPVVVSVKEKVDAEYAAGRNTVMGDEELEQMVYAADPDFFEKLMVHKRLL